MNRLVIIGNLTANPESYATNTGKTLAKFTVAVNEYHGEQKNAVFFRVTAWEKIGENCMKFLSKGKKVCVVGNVRASAFKNKNGEPAASLEVTAMDIEFLSPRNESESAPEDAAVVNTFTPIQDDENLPF